MNGQFIGLFTQLEEKGTDFRVSRLPHAVVKQAEYFRVRELVKKDRESSSSRSTSKPILQQNNVYNPFSDDSKAMIREMDNVELFVEIQHIVIRNSKIGWTEGEVHRNG